MSEALARHICNRMQLVYLAVAGLSARVHAMVGWSVTDYSSSGAVTAHPGQHTHVYVYTHLHVYMTTCAMSGTGAT